MSPTLPLGLAGLARRWMVLVVGMSLLLVGVAASINAGIGVGSWQVFETGLASTTGLPLGWVLLLESLSVLALTWLVLGIRPGPATVLLAIAGGPVVDWLTGVLPVTPGGPAAVAMLLVASCLIGGGVSLYVPAELGPSAQDSLFVGLYRKFRIRPGVAKFTTDAALVLAGWLLGGQIGLGTIIVTVVIPPVIDLVMPHGHALAGTPVPAAAAVVESPAPTPTVPEPPPCFQGGGGQ